MSEIQLQRDCYLWFHNSFPDFRGLLCYNLNNSANRIQGNMNMALGLQKGRADMVFYFYEKCFMFEFKTEEGYQSKSQKEWEKLITAHGFEYIIIRSLEQFKKIMYERTSQGGESPF